jgi:hypothetical protein
MPSLVIAFPLLPGKAEPARQTAQEEKRRLTEFAESRRQAGITKEVAFLQHTPAQDLVVVYWEAIDVEHALHTLAVSDLPYDRWFRERLSELHGMDPSQPPPPLPELLVDWEAVPE